MKKVYYLFWLVHSAVGCQNYDDQFDNLESQISALASTVGFVSGSE